MIFSLSRVLARAAPTRRPIPSRCLINRLYSDGSPLPRTDWRTAGIPSPPSLVPEDEPGPLSESDPEDDTSARRILPRNRLHPPKRPTPAQWAAHRTVLRESFPEGWQPPRKLSREAMDALRQFHRIDPATFTTPVLAERFRISPEAVRRILRSKWEPSRERRIELVREERERARMKSRERAQREAEELARIDEELGRRRGAGGDDRDRLSLD